MPHKQMMQQNPTKTSCITCKLRKVKCIGRFPPCESCHRLRLDCAFPGSPDAATDLSNNVSPQLVSPTETRTEAGTVRRRASTACDQCRVQKAKCSGHRPRCHRCSRRGQPCNYQASGRRRQALRPSLQEEPREEQQYGSLVSASSASSAMSSGSPVPLNVTTQQRLLARDVIARHIEAYFEYVYHLPGYDFFHRPTILQDFHNNKLPPVFCVALCAAVAMYVSSTCEAKQLSVLWAKDIDAFIFSNLNNLSTLNLQIIVLSMFQHFAYRQFGRVWLMHGIATRLALSLQLNRESHSTNTTVSSRECMRRLAWSLFLHDKTHSGGVEEFTILPQHWMHISLPMNDNDFQLELDKNVGTLTDNLETLASNNLGTNGYMILVQMLRHKILQTTKDVLTRKIPPAAEELDNIISSLTDVQSQLEALYLSLPPHLGLSERNILALSTRPDFAAYIALHTWYFQGSCDLYRICLPGTARESMSAGFLENMPSDFVAQWQRLAVSYAVLMAKSWDRLLDLKRSGALSMPGGLIPLSPENCVSIHQCTKILLIARSYQLYSGLVDPVSGEPEFLDDQMVEKLCQSNIAFLEGLARIAPIAAVVQQDVKEMLAGDKSRIPAERAPVTSAVQREKILSRYHTLAMGIAASSEGLTEEAGQHTKSHLDSPSFATSATDQSSGYLNQVLNHPTTISTSPLGDVSSISQDTFPHQSHLPYQNGHLDSDVSLNENENEGFWEGSATMFMFPTEYSVAASKHDMDGELNQFLMNMLL